MLQQIKSALVRSGEWARSRHDYANLASMDDYLLRDIGVHRGDVRARIAGRSY